MITFRTTRFYRLFGLPMSELANQVLDIETVFPLPFRQRWRLLLEQLKHVSSVQDQIGLIDRQLLAHVNRMPSYKGWVEQASSLLAHPGNGRIQKLAVELRISPRQLSREFTRQVGISPKRFRQVMRFRHVFRAIHTQQRLTWLDLVYLGGWYDQAHFCNDLYELTGLTPSVFFAQHHATTGMLINNHDFA
ncbi:helix-turn-helix domain-containing protein [Fibrella forsythiae]|uniref:AraC family transcriptional regulator n=1 Tax=Fibrella forsythiae TaxID=2817061 RepID=A0ABS3JSI6_9BACT|nr:helix-turn-helix domain-containing protein [Fibrella forsythiae]MBO0952969.1 AraC family transcriptional regulator [Fibrella forsythiae]